MEREIKFRVWDVEKNKFIIGLTYRIENVSASKKDWHILSQYVGLKDKNGKEIYELDYVLDQHNQRILVEYDFSLLSRLKEIEKYLLLDGNYYEQ